MARITIDALRARIHELEQQLSESDDTLRALRNGEVDAVVTSGPHGDQIYTLRGADEPYRLMVEQMAEGALTLTADGLILYSNEQFAALVGSSNAQVTGSDILNYVAEEDKETFSTLLRRSRRGPVKAEISFRSVSGVILPAYVSINQLTLDGVDGFCALITDLREQKRTEKLLDEGRISASIFEQIGEALLVVDPNGWIVRASHAADRLAGTPVLHRQFDDVLNLQSAGQPGSPRYPFQEIWAAAARGESVDAVEVIVPVANGGAKDCLLTARGQLSEAAKLLGCIVSLTDITVRKRAETDLQLSERREREKARELEAILEVVPAVLFIARDRECRSMVGSRFAYDLLRVPYGMNLSKSAPEGEAPAGFRVVQGGEEVSAESLPVQHCAATGEEVRDCQVELVFNDGTHRILLGNAAPLMDADGNLRGSVGAFQEVTHLKRIEEALRRSNQDLEHFAYAVSHDLHEPLRTVATLTELLVRKQSDCAPDESLKHIQGAVKRMASLIEDLLEYSRVTHQDVRIDRPIPAEGVLLEALGNLRTAIEESESKITFDSLPMISADPRMMMQMFQNLIGNAIKYQSDKPPEVHVAARRDGNQWTFRVEDNGIGIDMQHAETIFGVFKRLHGRQEYSGTGIGLALCKRIVERHGGKIWVESTRGKGSIFYFTLPDRYSIAE
jgi:PAS domain S-box-containing protein